MRIDQFFDINKQISTNMRGLSASLLGLTAFLGASLALATPTPLHAVEFTADQKTEIGKVVHDYLMSNPEVIKDAIDELEKRQKVAENDSRKKVVTENASKLFNSPNQAVVGNPNGDVTLVEFFDYNCGYCKQSLANVTKLIEGDPKLRVVLKDFPILGPDSVEVAQIATALREQFDGPKFWEFHRKLLNTRGHIAKAQALAVAKELGADMDRLERDSTKPSVSASLQEVEHLADGLKFSGTPSWVLGKEAFVGGLPLAEMKSKVEAMHKCGKTLC